MIGSWVDEVDAPRLLRGKDGWWFLGNGTWSLLRPDHVDDDGNIRADIHEYLEKTGAYQPRVPKSFSLTVLTSTACNLGCGYCFQNTALDPSGGDKPLRIVNRRLRSGTIDRIVEFTAARMRECELDKLYLLLFGGEPLLNPRGCLEMLEKAQTIGMYLAHMTTNGVLLTPGLATELCDAGLRGVQVTFDGSREDHDRIRVRHSGGPTFDTIVENVAAAGDATKLGWNFRINVSHRNFDRIDEIFAQLIGKVDPAHCALTFAWVGDAGFGYGNSLRHDSEVCDAFVRWAVTGVEHGFRVVKPTMRKTCQICTEPGGRLGAVVNADGTLYSCWQSAGKKGWEVGNIDDGYLDVSQVQDRWVTCGYEYQQADQSVLEAFRDSIDARFLDYLHTTGRL